MADTKRRHRVLVVEDEDNIALALDFLMTREGYDHSRVADGAEALEATAYKQGLTPRRMSMDELFVDAEHVAPRG